MSFCTNPSRKINTGRNIPRTTIPLSWKCKIKWHSIFYPPNANFGNQHDNKLCHETQPVMVTAEAGLAPDRGSWAGLCVSAAPGSRPEHLPPPQRCHWGFHLHHWLKPCSQPYTSNSKKRALFSVHIFSFPYGIDLATTVEEKKIIDFWVKSCNNEFQLFQVFST